MDKNDKLFWTGLSLWKVKCKLDC